MIDWLLGGWLFGGSKVIIIIFLHFATIFHLIAHLCIYMCVSHFHLATNYMLVIIFFFSLILVAAVIFFLFGKCQKKKSNETSHVAEVKLLTCSWLLFKKMMIIMMKMKTINMIMMTMIICNRKMEQKNKICWGLLNKFKKFTY